MSQRQPIPSELLRNIFQFLLYHENDKKIREVSRAWKRVVDFGFAHLPVPLNKDLLLFSKFENCYEIFNEEDIIIKKANIDDLDVFIESLDGDLKVCAFSDLFFYGISLHLEVKKIKLFS